jgi:hypothetical protein
MGTKHTTPEFLYKYRSLAKRVWRVWIKQIITDCQIYYPKPEDINDPFDCRMPHINSFSPWSARYWLAAQDAKTDEEHAQVWRKYREPLSLDFFGGWATM